MDRKTEKVKMAFFGNFDLFFGIYMILPRNFIENFASTDITTCFQKVHIDIFIKKIFSDDY